MHKESTIKALTQLGELLKLWGNEESWSGFSCGITEDEYIQMQELMKRVHIYNGWFDINSVKTAYRNWGNELTYENLSQWLKNYELPVASPKTVAIIMAGNIPLVGFHDLLCVYLSGHKALVKLSSDDDRLIPALIQVWNCFDDNCQKQISIAEGKIKNFDAVIATGSNNSAIYFENYFSKYPSIIRKNRTSVAVLSGNETSEQLSALGSDIFTFYGLGCRNVTKLFLPEGYDLNLIFAAIFPFQEVVNNKKYGNNYDYNKAIFLLERFDILENGFILFKEDEGLHSPLGTMYYEFYSDREKLLSGLSERSEELQCIVGEGFIPFGTTQQPCLHDYADGVDTLKFLEKL
jgi:hypothetical protein